MAFKFPTFKYDTNLVAQPDAYESKYSGFVFKPNLESTPQPGGQVTGQVGGEENFYGLLKDLLDPTKRAAARKGELQDLLSFQKEQMKQAAPYKLMFELPGKVMQAFAAPAQIRSNIMLAGQGAANQILAQGLQASALNMPSMGYQRPSTQYF